MEKNKTILLTGAAGFIGSYLLGNLNRKGYGQIIIADDFSRADKEVNYSSKKFIARVEREELFDWLVKENSAIDFVFHLGARTDTTEFDYAVHEKLNVEYSKKIWNYCTERNIPLVYASSAATYGSGELGYKDSHEIVGQLKPLNPYGVSKNEFDKWALAQNTCPPHWAGLKFFNVYGPNEYHKGRMASVIFHSFNQIRATGKVKLFKSHRPDFADGQQLRDFIYVEDVAKVCCWLMDNTVASGLYNLGTGKARSFEDLVKATFAGMDKEPVIEYIDMPEDIRDKYQYFTEADMTKLISAGYDATFFSLEKGVVDYVRQFLLQKAYY
ncbi:MAG TPA: ADP-glyceromanno-heptose 6-epimerase [Chitinophagaceae bacterium]|nr:ADP-glyceromanno-heptose 6-epimerase [Chitinophagaceae bacterium]HMU57316.1 ADP-glyceromanno-heptose 6-epimerase [Chitinophagaceae bacterium]